ncbi:MAG: endonuclease/exonuclease/phosphatase family protein [Prevotella sp.]|nr:endonuclease/exonuclease/phosphatase family protein [Prevotella sp.]
MLKHIKAFFISLLTGANVATVLLMLGVAYSDRISPADHPWMGCLGLVLPFFLVVNLLFLLLWTVVKWKRAWIPVAGFALAYPPMRAFVPMNLAGEESGKGITVMTYNVCGYGGNYKYEHAIDTVAGYLARIDADIVCLQEDKSEKFDPLPQLKELYPYNDTTHIQASGNKHINAVGIHTRFPIVRKERIEYESRTNGSVAYFLKMDEDTIIVINNHLESTHLTTDDRKSYKEVLKGKVERDSVEDEAWYLFDKLSQAAAQRAPQAEAVHQYIEAHADYPIIVCGDFNDTPNSYTRHTMAKGLTDCFVEAGMGPGLSYNQKGFNFRIDHILCSAHFEPTMCKVDSKMDASDHYPVVCRLKIADNH